MLQLLGESLGSAPRRADMFGRPALLVGCLGPGHSLLAVDDPLDRGTRAVGVGLEQLDVGHQLAQLSGARRWLTLERVLESLAGAPQTGLSSALGERRGALLGLRELLLDPGSHLGPNIIGCAGTVDRRELRVAHGHQLSGGRR